MTADQLLEWMGQITALVAALGTGWFAAKKIKRADAIQDATSGVEIAQARVEAAIPSGQLEEIQRLQKSVQKMAEEMRILSHRVADLEIALDGIEAYMDLIILCEECRDKNAKMISRISELLRRRGTGGLDEVREALDKLHSSCANTA
jgi:HAMP domain-containing protein